jgi:hypothetical protein
MLKKPVLTQACLFCLCYFGRLILFDVAVKEEEEAAMAAMDELAEANKEFLQGMGGVVGEEALEYVKFVFITHVGGTLGVYLPIPTIL